MGKNFIDTRPGSSQYLHTKKNSAIFGKKRKTPQFKKRKELKASIEKLKINIVNLKSKLQDLDLVGSVFIGNENNNDLVQTILTYFKLDFYEFKSTSLTKKQKIKTNLSITNDHTYAFIDNTKVNLFFQLNPDIFVNKIIQCYLPKCKYPKVTAELDQFEDFVDLLMNRLIYKKNRNMCTILNVHSIVKSNQLIGLRKKIHQYFSLNLIENIWMKSEKDSCDTLNSTISPHMIRPDCSQYISSPNHSTNLNSTKAVPISISVIDVLTKFATHLYNDCQTFKISPHYIESDIKEYLGKKLRLLQTLAVSQVTYADKALQTDMSTNCGFNQKYLEHTFQSCNLLRNRSNISNLFYENNTFAPSNLSDLERIPNEYDDRIPMAIYIQSEIFGNSRSNFSSRVSKISKNMYSKSSCSSSYSDDPFGGILQVCDSFKKVSCLEKKINENNGISIRKTRNTKSSGSNYSTDKEVERLLNIKDLGKRSNTTCSNIKRKKNMIYAVSRLQQNQEAFDFEEEGTGRNIASDTSLCVVDEEYVTEEQYLQKCNANLKYEFLDASSSGSFTSDNESIKLNGITFEDDFNKSPLVDKFLKCFVVKEGNLQTHHENADQTSEDYIEKHLKDQNSLPTSYKKEEQHGEISNIQFNAFHPSEVKLFNKKDSAQKFEKVKSIETLLSEMENKTKSNRTDEDFISISSESTNTDESIEMDDTEKKRTTKQLLRTDQLATDTRKAQKEETERIKRLEKTNNRLLEVIRINGLDAKNLLILDFIEESQQFIQVHHGIVKFLKEHQIDGVKFMYDSCFGALENKNKFRGSGCILAHCMGLGKTLQLIALLHTVISYKELNTSKILILCPKSTVMNWADEFRRWLGPLRTRNYSVFTFNDTSDIFEKLNVLKKWSASSFGNAGFLLIGYEAFRSLVFYHSYKNRNNLKQAKMEELRERIKDYMLSPGADLVVCDEGHIIKNNKSAISVAVSKIDTPKRIILTGTPIQNNLKEYYSMVNFIKPSFLGTEKEFANLYANPIKNGQHKDSSKMDIKIMKQRSFVLHKKLSKFVQVLLSLTSLPS